MRLIRSAAALLMVMASAAGAAAQKDTVTADETAAMAQFDAAVSSYMALRQKLRDEISGPIPGSTALQLNRASDALAAAIQRARSDARVGSIFVDPAAVVVKRRVSDLVRVDHGAVLDGIDDPPVTVKAPAIHLRFPAASQLATMPPSLLAVLPQLPKELEYRIIGDYLVLRDVDAGLILDYIPAAVPRKP